MKIKSTTHVAGRPHLEEPHSGRPRLGKPHLGRPRLGKPHLGRPRLEKPRRLGRLLIVLCLVLGALLNPGSLLRPSELHASGQGSGQGSGQASNYLASPLASPLAAPMAAPLAAPKEPPVRTAQAAVDPIGYRFRKIRMNLQVLRNGTIDVTLEADFALTRDLRISAFSLPYAAGQGLVVNQLSVTEIGETGTGTVYTGHEVNDLAQSSQVGSYQIIDNGRGVDLSLLTSAPQGSVRRVRLNYLIYQGSVRYEDVATITQMVLGGTSSSAIDKLGITISFEAAQMESEVASFRLFEHHNQETADNLLKAVSTLDFAELMEVPVLNSDHAPQYIWCYYGENIPARTRLELRLIAPSVWLPRAQVTAGEGPALPQILREEDAYTRSLLQRFEYRVIINRVVIGLFVVALILLLVMHRYNILAGYTYSRKKISEPPESVPPGLLPYLAKERVTSRVILSSVYRLVDQGFLLHDGRAVSRVPERLLPDDRVLRPYESAILHFIWNLMDGEDRLVLNQMDQLISDSETVDRLALIRIRNLLDAEAAVLGLMPLPDERKPAIDQILAGAMYLLLAVALSAVGQYYIPLLLLLPSATFFALAFLGARLTQKGRQVLSEAQAYSRYLSEIDRQGLSSADELKNLDRDFIYSVALGCEKNFLTNIRYVIPLEEVLSRGFFGKFGFSRMQKVVESYIDRHGSIKARYIRQMVTHMYRRVQLELVEWQSAIVRLNLLRGPQEVPESEYSEV